MARTATPPLIPPKAPEAPKKDEPVIHETFDLRTRTDGKFEIVRVQYGEGLSEVETLYVSESGPLTAKAWTLITRRKLGPVLDPGLPLEPFDMKVLE